MLKKFVFYSVFTSSLVLNAYLLTTEVEVVNTLDDEMEQVNDKVAFSQSAIAKKRGVKNFKDKNIQKIRSKVLKSSRTEEQSNASSKIDKDQVEELDETQIEQAMNAWKERTRGYMERDLGLFPEQVDEYFLLSENRQREISDYIKSISENRSDDMHFLSMEENIEISKINERYLNSMKRLLGEQGYKSYQKFRHHEVKKMVEEGDSYFFPDI